MAGEEVGSEISTTNPFLQIVENPDGTIRRPESPSVPPSGEGHVISKDVVLNADNATWLRLYLPNTIPPPPLDGSELSKLPIVLFFHGGGFVLFSAASVFYHKFCENLAAALPALVVSVNYRLAPEHRLPAAYDDAEEAALWLAEKASAEEPWLNNHGDLRRLFLMGSSSGANIVYHMAFKSSTSPEFLPLKISGVILNQPYLGGLLRTSSEESEENDVMLPLRANDMMWRLVLPEGLTRDHEYCDLVAALRRLGGEAPPGIPKFLVVCHRGDPLFDRQKELAAALEDAGVEVAAKLDGEGFHAVELFVPAAEEKLFDEIRKFISL